MYTIEPGKDKKPRTCSCCGGDINSAYGFVYKDGDAFSIYQVSWSDAHPEAGIDVALNFAKNGDFENPKKVYAIGILIKSTEHEYQFSFLNPENSSWSESNLREKMFTRDEALLHPQKSEFFRIAEYIIMNDPRVMDALG